MIKCKNCNPDALEIDTDLQRLYCSTREGMVLILDIKSETPVMIHTIWLGKVGPPSEKQDFIVQMDLDTDRNMLLCRSRFGIIFWV